jgi:hypothetical protein
MCAGKKAYIVMPKNAPPCKLAAVRDYNGTITLCEPTQASREATANALLEVDVRDWNAADAPVDPERGHDPAFRLRGRDGRTRHHCAGGVGAGWCCVLSTVIAVYIFEYCVSS